MHSNIRYSFKEVYTPKASIFPSLKGKIIKRMPQENVQNCQSVLEKEK